jgi:hypothetical protein
MVLLLSRNKSVQWQTGIARVLSCLVMLRCGDHVVKWVKIAEHSHLDRQSNGMCGGPQRHQLRVSIFAAAEARSGLCITNLKRFRQSQMTETQIIYQNLSTSLVSLGFRRQPGAAATNLHAFCHEATDTILAFDRPTGELVTPADRLDGGSLMRPRHLGEPAY